MILTGKKLEEFGLDVVGPDWKTRLAARLETTRQTIHARAKSPTGLSKAIKRQLLAIAEEQLATVASWVDTLREDLGE
jgi:hypothetical protein